MIIIIRARNVTSIRNTDLHYVNTTDAEIKKKYIDTFSVEKTIQL